MKRFCCLCGPLGSFALFSSVELFLKAYWDNEVQVSIPHAKCVDFHCNPNPPSLSCESHPPVPFGKQSPFPPGRHLPPSLEPLPLLPPTGILVQPLWDPLPFSHPHPLHEPGSCLRAQSPAAPQHDSGLRSLPAAPAHNLRPQPPLVTAVTPEGDPLSASLSATPACDPRETPADHLHPPSPPASPIRVFDPCPCPHLVAHSLHVPPSYNPLSATSLQERAIAVYREMCGIVVTESPSAVHKDMDGHTVQPQVQVTQMVADANVVSIAHDDVTISYVLVRNST